MKEEAIKRRLGRGLTGLLGEDAEARYLRKRAEGSLSPTGADEEAHRERIYNVVFDRPGTTLRPCSRGKRTAAFARVSSPPVSSKLERMVVPQESRA